LVERPEPVKDPTAERDPRRRWLTLDPTPAGELAAAAAVMKHSAWADALEFTQFLWEFFILDYSGEEPRSRLMVKLASLGLLPSSGVRLWRPMYLVVIGAAVLALAGLLWLWKRHRREQPARGVRRTLVAFYDKLLKLLARAALRPRPAQTPQEFATRAAGVLGQQPKTAGVADVPGEIVAAFYGVRYGDEPLEPEDEAAIHRKLQQLQQALERPKD
jgi:hypothetical protein